MDSGGTAPNGTVQAHKISAISTYLPGLLDALTRLGLNGTDMVMVALGCVCTETSDFTPRVEGLYDLNTTGTYTSRATGDVSYVATTQKAHADYPTLFRHHLLHSKRVHQEDWSQDGKQGDIYQTNKDLGNTADGDGWKYRGRGFIQLTGRSLYRIASVNAGLGDLFERDPDAVASAEYAGAAVAGYLSINRKDLERYIEAKDLKKVRKSVNGRDNGLDAFVASWNRGLRVIGEAIIQEAKVTVFRKRAHTKRRKK